MNVLKIPLHVAEMPNVPTQTVPLNATVTSPMKCIQMVKHVWVSNEDSYVDIYGKLTEFF